MRPCDTVAPLSLFCRITLEDNRVTTFYTHHGPHLQLLQQAIYLYMLAFICACPLLWDVQRNGRFATDLQSLKQTSGCDPRTGTFHQMWPTAGDTSCSVKGVLPFMRYLSFSIFPYHWTIRKIACTSTFDYPVGSKFSVK